MVNKRKYNFLLRVVLEKNMLQEVHFNIQEGTMMLKG